MRDIVIRELYLAGIGALGLGWFGYALTVVWILGLANAFNFMDGLDGFAGGVAVIVAMFFAGITSWQGGVFVSAIAYALAAGTLGFLLFNFPPARIFMGDVGSLSLGGTLAILAVLTKHEILLALVGGIFVLETLSVIIQVVSFKTTGKRVFAMAPIHHHYEKKGWSEPKIIVRFWIISIILALVALSTLKLR